MSACGGCCDAGDRPDVGEHAAGVPDSEHSYERRGAVDLDAAAAVAWAGELAAVPFDEGFGVGRGAEVLAEAGYIMADAT